MSWPQACMTGTDVAGVVLDGDLARVGQARLLLDRQGVHVGADEDGRPLAVLQDADDAEAADVVGDLVAELRGAARRSSPRSSPRASRAPGSGGGRCRAPRGRDRSRRAARAPAMPEAAGSASSPGERGSGKDVRHGGKDRTLAAHGVERQRVGTSGEPEGRRVLAPHRRRHAAVVFVGPAARARVDRAARVSDLPRRGHQDRRPLLARAGAVELQVPVVAADGPLRPPLRQHRPPALLDPRSARRASDAGILGLAAFGGAADVGVVAALALFVAFASASQDIVIDAYAVEVLERSEQGIAVGARSALARTAVLLSGAVTITLGQRLGWPPVFVGAGAALRADGRRRPPVARAARSRRRRRARCARRSSTRCSTSSGAPTRSRSSGFLVLYKFGENLATALTRPFLIQKCFVPEDVGVATATIGLIGADRRDVLRRRLDGADRPDALPLDLRRRSRPWAFSATSRSTS